MVKGLEALKISLSRFGFTDNGDSIHCVCSVKVYDSLVIEHKDVRFNYQMIENGGDILLRATVK